jgi:uncharacterized protein (DUF3820 family)
LQCHVQSNLKDAIRAELARRGLGFGKHKDKPLDQIPTAYLRWLLESDFGLRRPWGDLVKEELVEAEGDMILRPFGKRVV